MVTSAGSSSDQIIYIIQYHQVTDELRATSARYSLERAPLLRTGTATGTRSAVQVYSYCSVTYSSLMSEAEAARISLTGARAVYN